MVWMEVFYQTERREVKVKYTEPPGFPVLSVDCSEFCSPATVTSKLPILSWLPGYTRHDAVSDAIAGVTVGLTVIPQGEHIY